MADFRRHPGDAVRLVLALGLLALVTIPVVRQNLPVLERDAFRFFNDLPSWLLVLVWPVMQLGSFAVVPAVAILAAWLRGRRMAVDLLLAGGVAYLLAKAIKAVIERGRPLEFLTGVHLRGGEAAGLGFVSGHAAVAAALATAAGPWLGRRARRLAWSLALVVMLARVYTGAHLPLDVIGGALLGWAVGAAVHLAMGAPAARLSPETARTVLSALGFAVEDVVAVQASGRHAVVGTAGGEVLYATVVSREHRDLDLVHRGWRRLVSRWVRERGTFASPGERLHHHAAISLLARNAGVRVPEVLAVGRFGNGAGVLVERHVEGTRLGALGTHQAQRALPDVWAQVGALHAARIAHGDLRPHNVLVDGDGAAWLLDFTTAVSGADATRMTQDLSDLLAGVTGAVGAEVAVATAAAALGPDALAPVPHFLAGARRSGESRHVRRARADLLAALAHDSAARS